VSSVPTVLLEIFGSDVVVRLPLPRIKESYENEGFPKAIFASTDFSSRKGNGHGRLGATLLRWLMAALYVYMWTFVNHI